MANKLPGNPYAHYAEAHMDPALATLALAYEQRTANETLNRIADALERLHV